MIKRIKLPITPPVALKAALVALRNKGLRPLFVGGVVRDALLETNSSDYDIEVYGLESLQTLIDLLEPFGAVDCVGAHFAVVKLEYQKGHVADFSLPRVDSKIAQGHRGFEVETISGFDFAAGAKRRDFTINAMGYCLFEQALYDPYGGREDLKDRILRVVDTKQFAQDPLRMFRAVGFVGRLGLDVEPKSLELLRQMSADRIYEQLPHERIALEFEKLLLKAVRFDLAFGLIGNMQLKGKPLELLEKIAKGSVGYDGLVSLRDYYQKESVDRGKTAKLLWLYLMMQLDFPEAVELSRGLFQSSRLDRMIATLYPLIDSVKDQTIEISKLKLLSIEWPLEELVALLLALRGSLAQIELYRCSLAECWSEPYRAIVDGALLCQMGLKPSKEFGIIIRSATQAEILGQFDDKKGAIEWIRAHFVK